MKGSIRLFAAVLFFAVVSSLGSSAQAHFSTAGGGGFWGPGLTDQPHEWSSQAFGTTLVVNAGEVRVRQFILQSSFTIGHITTVVLDGPYSGTFDFGIYDASGNLLLDAGVFNGAYAEIGVVQTLSITSVTLCPGTYYFAQTATESSVQPVGVGGSGSIAAVDAISNATTQRIAVAANGANSLTGALPSTLGALTAETTDWTGTGLAFFEP
jgi:hypothetical protein